MTSVLIVDGGNYCSTLDKVEQTLKHGEIVSHIKVAAEIERILDLKFSTKFFFQGTQSTKPNDFHKDLGKPPPHGPHYNLEIFGKKKQSGQNVFANRKEIVSILVEEGVDVAVGTKIIECAYGIGKEQECDKIVVITGDGDLLRAIECADGKKRNTIHVIAARESLSNSLNRFVHVDRDTGCAVYLDEIMRRCVSVREGYEAASVVNGNGQVSTNTVMSQQSIFATATQSYYSNNNNNNSNFNNSSSSKTSVPPLTLGAVAKVTMACSANNKASSQNYDGPQSNPILFPNNTASYDANFPAFSMGSAPAAPAPTPMSYAQKRKIDRIQRQKANKMSGPTADNKSDRKHDNALSGDKEEAAEGKVTTTVTSNQSQQHVAQGKQGSKPQQQQQQQSGRNLAVFKTNHVFTPTPVTAKATAVGRTVGGSAGTNSTSNATINCQSDTLQKTTPALSSSAAIPVFRNQIFKNKFGQQMGSINDSSSTGGAGSSSSSLVVGADIAGGLSNVKIDPERSLNDNYLRRKGKGDDGSPGGIINELGVKQKRRGSGISQPPNQNDHKRPRPVSDTNSSDVPVVWNSTLNNNNPIGPFSSDSGFPSNVVRNYSNSVSKERIVLQKAPAPVVKAECVSIAKKVYSENNSSNSSYSSRGGRDDVIDLC